jgi:hypothetical protein
MQRSAAATVALALLLITAGCSGVLGGGTPTDTGDRSPTDTGSPSPVDDGAGSAVPGVANGTLTNATALLAAHDEGLLATGFENQVRVNATVLQQGQRVDVTRRQQTLVEPDRTEFRYRSVNGQGSGFVRFDHWGNRSTWVVRGQYGETTRIQLRDRTPATGTLTGSALLSNYLQSGAAVTNVTERDGLTYATMETTEPPATGDALPDNATNVRDYRARTIVDSQGRIHALAARGTYDLAGETETFAVSYRTVRLDEPSVGQPDWAAEALASDGSGG